MYDYCVLDMARNVFELSKTASSSSSHHILNVFVSMLLIVSQLILIFYVLLNRAGYLSQLSMQPCRSCCTRQDRVLNLISEKTSAEQTMTQLLTRQ